MFKAVVGQAEGVHTEEVIRRVIEQCRLQLGGMQPQGGLLFAARHFEQDILLAEIRTAFPDVRLAGCTDGSMFGPDRLMQVVREHAHESAENILAACFDAIREFRSPLPPEDDETLVIIKAVEH